MSSDSQRRIWPGERCLKAGVSQKSIQLGDWCITKETSKILATCISTCYWLLYGRHIVHDQTVCMIAMQT